MLHHTPPTYTIQIDPDDRPTFDEAVAILDQPFPEYSFLLDYAPQEVVLEEH